jgi:hypothetical protein
MAGAWWPAVGARLARTLGGGNPHRKSLRHLQFTSPKAKSQQQYKAGRKMPHHHRRRMPWSAVLVGQGWSSRSVHPWRVRVRTTPSLGNWQGRNMFLSRASFAAVLKVLYRRRSKTFAVTQHLKRKTSRPNLNPSPGQQLHRKSQAPGVVSAISPSDPAARSGPALSTQTKHHMS